MGSMAAVCVPQAEPSLNQLFILRSAFLRYKEPMKNRLLISVLILLAHTPLQADSLHDHDRARQALLAGEILPLKTILERVERSQPGQVMEVELEQNDHAGWIYEIKLLQTEGRLLKLYVDARSGEILRVKQKDQKESKDKHRTQEPR